MGTVSGIARPTTRAQQLRREATPAERKLWHALGACRLGVKFSRQMPVGPYICDFLSRSAMLAVEVDGDTHATTADHDEKRDAFIRARGIAILRFSNSDVIGNLEGVVMEIERVLAALPTPSPSRKREGDKGLPSRLREGSGVGASPTSVLDGASCT